MAQTRTGKVEQQSRTEQTQETATLEYEIISDQKVYGRQAVQYQLKEIWDTRPMPDNTEDVPVPDNRGLYKRPDGTMYQIDACGAAHEKLAEGNKTDKPVNVYNIFHYGKPDCQCMHCQNNRHSGDKHIINHGEYKPAEQLKANEVNRISWPGDVDYVKTDEPTDLPEGKPIASGPLPKPVIWKREVTVFDIADGVKTVVTAKLDDDGTMTIKDMKQTPTETPVVQSIWNKSSQ